MSCPVALLWGIWLRNLEKNVEDGLIRIYDSTDKQQVFIAYDKQGGCRPETREGLERSARIRLPTDGCELYGRLWNKEENKPNEDELQQTVETID